MTILLMVDPQTEIVDELRKRLLSYYNLPNVDIAIKLIENVPKYEDEYQLDRKHQYITDYFRLQDQAVYVSNIWNIDYVADIIASEYIKPKVWFTDDTETARKWIGQLPDLTCWDIETTGLKRPAIEQITMSGFSINHLKAMVFIHTEEIEKLIMEFLITTDKTIGVHNILFEQRYVYDRTRKFIKKWEDSQLLASAYLNSSPKPLVGLKVLAEYPYKDWAASKESFDLYKDSSAYVNENLIYIGKSTEYRHYNLPLVYYNGIDVTATHHLLNKYLAMEPEFKSVPIEKVLPIPAPKDYSESIRFFYENVMKPVIKPIVKMLHNGMPIDVSQLPALRTKVESIRATAYKSFINNELIKPYAEEKMKNDIAQFLDAPSLKGFVEVLPEQCPIKEYKNVIAINQYIFDSIFVCQINKKPLTLKEMKEFPDKPQILEDILNKVKLHQYADQLEKFVKGYQIEWAKKQNSIHNRLDKINNPMKYVYEDGQIINPQSSNQMGTLWNNMGVHSPVMTDGGAESFNMKVIEEFSKSHPEDNIRYAMKDILSIAEGRNLISQYLPRYEQSSYDNKIQGILKFPGTLSFRLSGGGDSLDKDHPDKYKCGINGVTQPASTSKYFKEVKELFKSTDPEWLVYQIDYEGLELNVNANLTHDKTKLQILNDGFDMHTKHACTFYRKEIEEHIGKPIENSLEFNLWLKEEAFFKKYRNGGKQKTFKLEYGGFPDADKGGGITKEIFDSFHNELYPGVTKFKKEYVEPASQTGKLHLGFGAHIHTTNPKDDALTLFNVNFQFFSILVPIASAKFDNLIETEGMEDRVTIFNNIHDAIYGMVHNDAESVKWVNDNLVRIMCEDFLVDQLVPLKAAIDIGYDLYNVTHLPNNASIEVIAEKIEAIK